MSSYFEVDEEPNNLKNKSVEGHKYDELRKDHDSKILPNTIETSDIVSKQFCSKIEKEISNDVFTKNSKQILDIKEDELDLWENKPYECIHPHIGNIDEAPEWLIDNHFILTGYRIGFTKVKDVLKSLFMIHNETTNIWSHMLGIIMFILLTSYIIIFIGQDKFIDSIDAMSGGSNNSNLNGPGPMTSNNFDSTTNYDTNHSNFTDIGVDFINKSTEHFNNSYLHGNKNSMMINYDITRVPLYVHMVAALCCFSMSTFFHWFSWCNDKANSFLSRLDYSGISFLIAGSWMPPYFYSFYWDETIVFAYAYSILIFSICGIAFAITLLPKFDTPRFKKHRAIIYIIAGIWTAIPCFHLILDKNLKVDPLNAFLWILGGALYIAGATIYGVRFPERFFPRKFDYIGNSHNIFHFWSLLASFVHFFASLTIYFGRKALNC